MRIQTIAAASALALLAGCQTRITATKNPETVHPLQEVVKIGDTALVVTRGYLVASGGWEATARSPLWAREDLRGLEIAVQTNGTVTLALADYSRDLSTNAVAMTKTLVDGAVNLTARIAAAIATGGAATAGEAGVARLAADAYALFTSKGGNASAAKVTCADGTCTISDGEVGVTCANGVCSPL